MLAVTFGEDSKAEAYTYLNLLKMLGAMYNGVDHAVVAQRQIAQGLKQPQQELIVKYLNRVYQTYTNAQGRLMNGSIYIKEEIVTPFSMVYRAGS